MSGVTFLLVMARMTHLNRQLSDASEELEVQATTDPLTGLMNRAAFSAVLRRHLVRTPDHGLGQALLFVDLDDFKDVNDTLGHHAGDVVLQVAGNRLREQVRQEDHIARLGGDEFAIFLPEVEDEEHAIRVGGRLAVALAEPTRVDGHSVHVGASIGLAFRVPESTIEGLMRQADLAMYAAKGSGKSRVERYSPSLELAVAEEQRLGVELLDAVGAGQLVLEYQPCVDLHSGQVIGVEALVRWQHPTRGLLPPSAFIGLAERNGAIVSLGRWVLDTAAFQVAEWHRRLGHSDLFLSVNVSGRQLDRDRFVSEVLQGLETAGLPADRLILEVTESVLTDSGGPASGSLEQLRRAGVRVAVDDFGTGYSSMSYLHQLPVDIIKIDRSFVSPLEDSPRTRAVLEAIVGLGRHLGLSLIAEGIEDTEQLGRLDALGCPLGQGFLFSRPVPAACLEDLLGAGGFHVARVFHDVTTPDLSGPCIGAIPSAAA
jgi:diguanylate cyclase (GGDEF)-like protein